MLKGSGLFVAYELDSYSPVPGAVELAEKNRLPGAEDEPSLVNKYVL